MKNKELKKQYMKTVGIYLKSLRETADLSQAAIIADLGLTSQQYISNVERGISPPSIELLACYAKKCKVKTADLVESLSEFEASFLMQSIGAILKTEK